MQQVISLSSQVYLVTVLNLLLDYSRWDKEKQNDGRGDNQAVCALLEGCLSFEHQMAELRHDHHISHAEEAPHDRQVKIQFFRDEEHEYHVEQNDHASHEVDQPILGWRLAQSLQRVVLLTGLGY